MGQLSKTGFVKVVGGHYGTTCVYKNQFYTRDKRPEFMTLGELRRKPKKTKKFKGEQSKFQHDCTKKVKTDNKEVNFFFYFKLDDRAVGWLSFSESDCLLW